MRLDDNLWHVNANDVMLSSWAEYLCERLDVQPDAVRHARVDGTVVFEASRVEEGWVAIWGPRRPDGSHLHIVCGPNPMIVNDFRILRTKPSYVSVMMIAWPVDE